MAETSGLYQLISLKFTWTVNKRGVTAVEWSESRSWPGAQALPRDVILLKAEFREYSNVVERFWD